MARYDDDLGYASDRVGPVERLTTREERLARDAVERYVRRGGVPDKALAELLEALGLPSR